MVLKNHQKMCYMIYGQPQIGLGKGRNRVSHQRGRKNGDCNGGGIVQDSQNREWRVVPSGRRKTHGPLKEGKRKGVVLNNEGMMGSCTW